MKNIPLTTRLIILLALPLAGLAYFSASLAIGKWQAAHSYRLMAKDAQVLNAMGNLIHELQSERGRTAVYVGTRGARFATEVAAQRGATDTALAAWRVSLGEFDATHHGADLARELSAVLGAVEQLASRRRDADAFAVTPADMTAYFTQAIGTLLAASVELSRNVPDLAVSRGIASYVSFLDAKEQSGIERAVLAGVFSADKFTGDSYLRLTQAVAKQETYLHVFERFATVEQKQFCAETMQAPAVAKVQEMRKVALDRAETGRFGVESSVWFEAVTEKIGLLRQVEDRLARDYHAQSAAACRAAERTFEVTLGLAACVGLVTVVFGVGVMRSITSNLRETITALAAASGQTASAAAQVSNSSQSLARGASEQAASLEETAASLEEISSMTKRNAEGALEVKNLAGATRAAADTSAEDISQMTAAMEDIKASSNEIAKIVKTIDEIAFQTNILALNAAVEAARAGDAGAGFAVVAEEVRALAQRSAAAAKETGSRIETAINKSERGGQYTAKVASGLGDIVQKVRQVDTLIGEIATASSEQERGINEVNHAIGQMDRVTQANAANAEESAAAAEELNAQALSLEGSVNELQKLAGGGGTVAHQTPAVVLPPTKASAAPAATKPARGPAARIGVVDKHWQTVGSA